MIRPPTEAESIDPVLLPAPLRDWGFPYLDRDWCWVVEHDKTPIALVIASFSNGILVIWRVLSTEDAKRVQAIWFLASLTEIMNNAHQRGCIGYLSMFNDSHEMETKLARLVARTGGILKPFIGTLGIGVIPEGERCRTLELQKPSP